MATACGMKTAQQENMMSKKPRPGDGFVLFITRLLRIFWFPLLVIYYIRREEKEGFGDWINEDPIGSITALVITIGMNIAAICALVFAAQG